MNEDFLFEYSPFVIEAGKVREFTKALGIENPVYENVRAARESSHASIPVPPTFATVIDYWNKQDIYQLFAVLGLKPENVLHGEQSFDYSGRMHVGDVIHATAKLLRKVEKSGKNFYFLQTSYKNQADEILLTSHATLIEVLEVTP